MRATTHQPLPATRWYPPPSATLAVLDSAGGRGKGKGKGKESKGTYGRLPLQLRVPGAAGSDGDGNPICYGYALGTCTAAPPGGRRPKGRHVCILSACREPHCYVTAHPPGRLQ